MIFEFLIAAMVFFSIIFYILNYLSTSVATFSSDAYSDVLQSKAMQISELLVRTEGVWINNTPLTVGLVKSWPVMDDSKIAGLDYFCQQNYTGLLGLLGLKEGLYNRTYNVHILINNGDILDCGFPPRGAQIASVKRYALSEDRGVLAIDVAVW